MSIAETAARIKTKRKRQAAIKRALESPYHPRQIKANGVPKDYDNTEHGPIPKQMRRRRVRRVAKGQFDLVDWASIDQRPYRCREIKRIVKRLFADTTIDTYPKKLLAERCAFILALIQNAETMALAGKKFDRAEYISLVGKLQTILGTLGIDNNAKATGLAAHLAKKDNPQPKPLPKPKRQLKDPDKPRGRGQPRKEEYVE